jgi:hypothetical protein
MGDRYSVHIGHENEEVAMSSHQKDWFDVLDSVSPAHTDRRETGGRAPWSVRVWARLFASRFDEEIEAGVAPDHGSPLAAHWVRLTSARERQDLAFSLCKVVGDARGTHGGRSSRVPVQAAAVRQASDVVDEVLERLTGPVPVRARGTARLRILLADGRGPLYRAGRGTLAAAMRGVLAAL